MNGYLGANLNGYLWAVETTKPKVAFALGQVESNGCLAGVFFHSLKGASISGIQLCRPGTEFDQQILQGWNHERGRQILANMIFWFGGTPPPGFARDMGQAGSEADPLRGGLEA